MHFKDDQKMDLVFTVALGFESVTICIIDINTIFTTTIKTENYQI